MKIEKMTATFGTLNHATLEPGPGLTVIEAPNEAGKSTWCAFIRAMLYGVDTSERDKAGHLALKTRMKPWNNMPTVGTMELETGGKHITIQRYNQKNIPFARLTATYTGTAQHVPELTAANLGETLTGVTEDVFARTAYIRRPELQVNQTADLERRIASLVQTGDETSAFTEVEGELTSWQRKLTYGRSGEIPRLEAELREAEAAANALSASAAELGRLREQCARLEAQIAGYEKDLATHDRLEARSRARLLAQAKAQLAEREERTAALTRAATKNGQLMTLEDTRQIREAAASFQPLRRIRDEAEKTLFAAEKDLNDVSVRKASSPLAGLSEQEASELSRRGRELAAKAEEKKRKPLPRFIPGLLIALAAVCLLFTSGALLPFTQWVSGLAPYVGFRWQGLALGAALLALGLWFLLKKPAQPAAAKELASLLEKYGVSSAEKLSSLSSAYLAILRSEEPARAKRDAARDAYQSAATAAQEAQDTAVAAVAQFLPEIQSGFEIAAALEECDKAILALDKARGEEQAARARLSSLLEAYGELPAPTEDYIKPPLRNREDTKRMKEKDEQELIRLRAEYNRLSGSRQTLGDPAVLSGRVMALREALAEDGEKAAALDLALSTLREANTELTNRFSPLISKKAGEYLTRLTDGHYEKLAFDRGFAANVRREGEILDRSVLYLSDGTADQVWFSLRLSMCELMLTGAEPCPLILDDALLNFDDGRCREAVDLLLSLAEERQILLFTCHSREAAMVGDKAKVVRL